jgi:hypothetical protein
MPGQEAEVSYEQPQWAPEGRSLRYNLPATDISGHVSVAYCA